MKLSLIPVEDYKDASRHYDGLVAMKHSLPNFPLIGAGHAKFSHVMKEMGLDRSLEYSSLLHKKAAKKFPGMPHTPEAMRLYFQLRHSQPAISYYNQEHEEIELLFPVYETEQFYTMTIASTDLGNIIENEVILADEKFRKMRRETYKNKPEMQQFPVPMDFAEAVRSANTEMCNVFEKITYMQIYDPARIQEERLQDLRAQMKTHIKLLAKDPSVSDSVQSNAVSVHVDNTKTITMAAPLNKNGKTHNLTILN